MDILELVNGNDPDQVAQRRFVCDEPGCNKAFSRNSDLVRHARIHANDRPFACSYRGCGKAFIQRSALTVHMRVHTGERPHACTHPGCDKAFGDSSSLARHRRVHTGARPYHCEFPGCGKTFCRKITLTKHVKRTHSGPYMSPALTGSPGESMDMDDVSTSAYSPEPSYRGSPALSTTSAQQSQSRYMTPSPQHGLGISLPPFEPRSWPDHPHQTLSVPTPPQRSSSRLSNRSAPGCIQSSDDPADEVYPSPALTQASPPAVSHEQSPYLSSDMPAPDHRVVPQFARSRPIYLPPLRVQHDVAASYEAAAAEWDQRHYAPRAPDIPRFGVEPPSPMHRFDLHASSPTYPQYYSLSSPALTSPRWLFGSRQSFSGYHLPGAERRDSFTPSASYYES